MSRRGISIGAVAVGLLLAMYGGRETLSLGREIETLEAQVEAAEPDPSARTLDLLQDARRRRGESKIGLVAGIILLGAGTAGLKWPRKMSKTV